MPTSAEIRTPRLLLRRARTEDLTDLHAIFARMDAMRYWSTPPHESLEQTRRWLADMIAAPAAESDDFIVEYEGRAVGKAGAWRLPEIGFLLHPDLWGRGLMREALEALIAHLFASHPLPALTAEADPRNDRSLGLLRRIGFRETGRAQRTMQWGEEWCDSVYLALDRPAGPAGSAAVEPGLSRAPRTAPSGVPSSAPSGGIRPRPRARR